MATEINAGRVAMVPKGEWSASTAYVRLDVVQYNGSSYVARQDSTGQNPSTATTYWQLLASGVDPSNYYTKNETNTKLGSKQDALVSGQNIKTVNGQSVIGAGNLELGELFVVRMTRNNSNSVYTADKSVSEIYEASYTNGKPVIAVMRDINNPVFILSDCDPDGDSYVFSAIESNTVTTLRWKRTDDYTYELETMVLQPHLVSGTSIKTVNNESLLGSGNVDIVGKSAYQSYVDTTTDSPVKTEAEWVASLKGEDGVSLGEVAVADNLTTDDGTKVLSARQGYLLGQKVNDVDNVPTAGSEKFVKSGGVQNELALGAVYDVSVKNPTAGQNNDGKFESLSALLSDANLNTLIPTAYRKGGMSIKFVQSSDNKYVQYRLMSDIFNTTPANWQGVDDEPTANSDNLIKSGGVYDTIAKNIGDIIDISSIVNNPVLYDSVTSWSINNANYQGKWFPVVKGCKYKITPKNANNAMYSLLKSMDTSGAPDYASGTSRTIVANETIIELPQDTNYIWVMTKSSGADVIPDVEILGRIQESIENVNTEIRDTNLIFEGIDALPSYSGWLDGGSASVVDYQSSKFTIIPIKDRKKLHITTGSSACYIFIAKNYKTSPLPITIELATGETGRRSINANTDTTINLPNDAKYLYLQIVANNGSDMKPAYLSIDGIKVIDVGNPDSLILTDSEVTADSDNLITSGAVYDTVVKEVGMHIDIDGIVNSPTLYDDNGSWIINNASYQGKYFPCVPGKKYEIDIADGASWVMVSFLKTMNTTAPDYATGTGRNSYLSNVIVTAPSDANYMWVVTKYKGTAMIPSVFIAGYADAAIYNLYQNIDEAKTKLSGDISGLIEITSGIDNFTLFSGWLDGDTAKIVNYRVSKFIVIPVEGRKKLRIIANSINPSLMFIAKNYGTTITVELELATGETGRRSFSVNSDTTINIPSDAKYVYLQAVYYDGGNGIPAYLSIDNLQIIPEKIEDFTKIEDEKKKLRSALTSSLAQSQSSHIFTFIHTSDTHLKSGNDKQFANILSLLNEDYIDCLIHTGDIVWDNYPYNGDDSAVGLSMFNNLLQSVSKDVIISAGNHDVGGEYKDVNICGTDAQIYNTFYAPLMKNTFVSGGEGKSYFYVDYTQGVRVISLYQYNSDFELDPNDNTKLKDIRGRIAYRQDEIDWLCGVLNSTPEGYAVLLLTHQPESLGGKTNSWQSRQYVNSSWSTFLSDIVNAYIHREVVNTSIEQTVGVVGTIVANYDFSNAKGDFAGFVNGHTHDDFVGKEYNYDLNVLNKCCDNKLYQSGCSIAHIDNTPSENTINVVSINTQYRTISVFRVGGKYTADGDYRNVITLSY